MLKRDNSLCFEQVLFPVNPCVGTGRKTVRFLQGRSIWAREGIHEFRSSVKPFGGWTTSSIGRRVASECWEASTEFNLVLALLFQKNSSSRLPTELKEGLSFMKLGCRGGVGKTTVRAANIIVESSPTAHRKNVANKHVSKLESSRLYPIKIRINL